MSKLFFSIVVAALLISFQSEAQGRRYGSDGQLIENGYGTGQRSSNGPRTKEKVDYTKIMVHNLTTQLNLDAFQNVVLTKIFEEYNEKTTLIMSADIPTEAKSEKIKIAQTTMDERITEILTEKQKVSFVAMKDAKKNKKKKKKKNSDTEEIENEMF